MPGSFVTDPERHFLLHWHYEAAGHFWGPATIWCVNHRVNAAYGPYPLAELFRDEEREAGRTFWTGAPLDFGTPLLVSWVSRVSRLREPYRDAGMPTLTVTYETPEELRDYERAIAFVAEMRQLGLRAPDGGVIDACEALALSKGQDFLRDTLAAAVQARAADVEKKPDRTAATGRAARGGGRGRS